MKLNYLRHTRALFQLLFFDRTQKTGAEVIIVLNLTTEIKLL